MLSKWFNQGVNILIAVWMFITLLILICNGFFWINDYISHPQHGIFENFKRVSQIIQTERETWYRIYFVLDFIWALYLLVIIGSVAKDDKGIPLIDHKKSKTPASYIFICAAIFAFLFDCIEGVCYWGYWGTYLQTIANIKVACYVLCFCFLCYWLLKSYLLPNFKSILRFGWTSLFSILFILIIYALITMMPQGGTLIVDLFYQPWNIVILFFLLSFLAIIISHYPVYADIWTYADNSCVTLEMDQKSKFLGFGIIYYNPVKSDSEKSRSFKNNTAKGMRRSLGILLYIALFNILFGVVSRFFEVHFDVVTLTLFLLIATLFIYYLEGKKHESWKLALADKNAKDSDKKRTIKEIIRYAQWFPNYFIICTVLVGITALVAWFAKWDRWSIIVFLITLGFQMFLYVMFKISRSFLKYVYRSGTLVTSNPPMYNADTLKLFEDYDQGSNRGENSFYRLFGSLSDNVTYLKLMRFSGIVSLVLVVLANFSFKIATFFNPLVIILLYIILFYSIFVIAFKHILYYHRRPKGTYTYENFFKYGIPLIALLFLGLISYTSDLPNDLHQLTMVDRKHVSALDHNDYLNSMTKPYPKDRPNNYFFVGSYGGGLKANLWNLLLLHDLEKASDKEFLNRTLVMSGVSGGAVGIGNFSSLLYEQKESSQIAERIVRIGNSNVLSNELTYLLGRDWAREYVPFIEYEGKDRSHESMKHHAYNTGMAGYDQIGFDDYWRKIYESRNSMFPSLVINTTAVGGQQGIASTVKFPENTFAGARNITDFNGEDKGKTLTYFGAISTTNRFPFFSPTAKILNKGSYLDGGYFDNSGMLSTIEIYDAIAGDSTKPYFKRINPVFINIINSEEFYISQKLIEYKLKPKNINEASEIGSIIGTVTSIDKLPRYILEKIRSKGFAVELIMMPHKLSYQKIKNALNGEVVEPLSLMDKIKVHNDSIDNALKTYQGYDFEKWGVVQPPLARVLSKPAVHYQEAMVNNHASVKKTLQRIIDEYITTDTVIDTLFQRKAKRRSESKNINSGQKSKQ